MAVAKNLYVDQGSYFSSYFSVTRNGAPLNITGHTVKAQMTKYVGSSKSYDIPVVIEDALNGVIKFQIPGAVSDNYPAGPHFYDAELTDESGEKLRVVEGIINIRPQITKI